MLGDKAFRTRQAQTIRYGGSKALAAIAITMTRPILVASIFTAVALCFIALGSMVDGTINRIIA